MRDQATELRKRVRNSLESDASGKKTSPYILLLTGGKGGVGTTTMAINLSLATALNGLRVVLVDADLLRADIAQLCGLDEQESILDILTARRDIHEVLQRGPAGMQIVPGLYSPGSVTQRSGLRQHRLISQLRSLRRHADIVVVDAGNGSSETVHRFWSAADDIVLTTTPDAVAVMDTYATVKSMSVSASTKTPMRLLINQAVSVEQARDAHARMDKSCERFLQRELQLLGVIPLDANIPASAAAGQPLLLHNPECPATEQIQLAAAALCTAVEQRRNDDSERVA